MHLFEIAENKNKMRGIPPLGNYFITVKFDTQVCGQLIFQVP